MAAQSLITVFDGASTPVVHTLVGIEVVRDASKTIHALWREQIATVPEEAQCRAYQKKRRLPSGVTIAISGFEVPVMEPIAGQNAQGYTAPPKVAYIDTVELVMKSHPRSTEVTRRIAMQMLINWANNFTTSVTPVSTGVVADLNQRGINVT